VTPENSAITVDVWSDIACPWCYIGKRKFESGAEAFRAANPDAPEVVVVYHSFELSPDTPEDFVGSEAAYLAKHKGIPEGQAQAMLTRVTEIAASVGLDYDFEALQHVKTVTAHQVLHFAKARGRQLELKERLLRAYFTEGANLADVEVLASLAAEVGLDREDVLHSLAEQEYLAAVQADIAQAGAYGINGVPFFVLDGQYGVSGAQEASAFAEVLQHVLTQRSVAPSEARA
jgi:predicted DsbA family dithiol-disulfide isomerase